jgi:hypothetical protein
VDEASLREQQFRLELIQRQLPDEVRQQAQRLRSTIA